jgi:hypothetical protein
MLWFQAAGCGYVYNNITVPTANVLERIKIKICAKLT